MYLGCHCVYGHAGSRPQWFGRLHKILHPVLIILEIVAVEAHLGHGETPGSPGKHFHHSGLVQRMLNMGGLVKFG